MKADPARAAAVRGSRAHHGHHHVAEAPLVTHSLAPFSTQPPRRARLRLMDPRRSPPAREREGAQQLAAAIAEPALLCSALPFGQDHLRGSELCTLIANATLASPARSPPVATRYERRRAPARPSSESASQKPSSPSLSITSRGGPTRGPTPRRGEDLVSANSAARSRIWSCSGVILFSAKCECAKVVRVSGFARRVARVPASPAPPAAFRNVARIDSSGSPPSCRRAAAKW